MAQWSGAFISWVATEGNTKRSQFPTSAAHAGYANAIYTNGGAGRLWPWTALDPRVVSPRVGDIVIITRTDEGPPRTSTRTPVLMTFDDHGSWRSPGHGDFVMSVSSTAITVIGGNKGQTVKTETISLTDGKLPKEFYAILRPEPTVNIGRILTIATEEFNKWKSNGWKESSLGAQSTLAQYWRSVNVQYGGESATINPSPTPQAGPPISPYIAGMESLHPHIQYELTRRRNATETANVYMPYVRLTALTSVMKENSPTGQTGSYCPSLGIHGQPTTTFEELYYPSNNKSIVGYSTRTEGGKSIREPLIVESSEEDQQNIPVPGIVSISTDRNTAGPMGVRGGLFRATINIRAYSLGQLNTMLRYFMRPATRVILEVGRTSSSEAEQRLSDVLSTDMATGDETQKYAKELFQKFEWNRSIDAIKDELGPMIKLQKGQRDFIQRYIYNNFGDYEIFIGYVVSFKLRYTKENVYEVELLVHSVQQFEVPVILSGTKPTNTPSVSDPCKVIDIDDYFNPLTAFRTNSFLKVLAKATDSTDTELYPTWGNHVTALNGSTGTAQVEKPGYLVSWQFFVDVILNHNDYGILSIFQLNGSNDANTISVLRSGLISRIGNIEYPRNRGTDNTNLNSNEVSWHRKLRSTDPATLIIYNSVAQSTSEDIDIQGAITAKQAADPKALAPDNGTLGTPIQETVVFKDATNDAISNFIKNNISVGSFDNENGTSYLTKGVWLNTNAIIDAFSGADTITTGITRLLNAMNNSTQGFWNLQLLSAEPQSLGLHVVDMGLSKTIKQKQLMPQQNDTIITVPAATELRDSFIADVNKFKENPNSDVPKYLYMFNRKSRNLPEGDIGGELLDINIDSSLPQVIAVQAIAGVGGVAQRGTLNSIDVDQLKEISLFEVFPKNSSSSGTCADLSTFVNSNKTLTAEQVGQIRVAVVRPGTLELNKLEQQENYLKQITDQQYNAWLATEEGRNSNPTRQAQQRGYIEEDIASIRNERTILFERDNPGALDLIQKYSSYYGLAINLIETDISKFITELDIVPADERPDAKPHPFNSSNLTKTIVDLTLPGIGGIQLFQAFAVDRVPNILNKGYYVVTKVAHDFSTDSGWTTKIQGRFRYSPNPLVEATTP